MSKTTKIIAALGVVAGLGVAALPAFTYATASVSGQVEVRVDVDPAIAMTISGNNDYDGTTTPKPEGVQDGVSVYDGSSIIGGYNAANTNPQGVDKNADGYTIQTSGSKLSILPNQFKQGTGTTGEDTDGFGSLVTVYTNNGTYSLSVADADSDTSLRAGTQQTTDPEIPALNSEATTPIGIGVSAWGYKLSGTDNSWVAMQANTNARVLVNGGAASTAGNPSTILYAVSTSPTQATGTYKDTIVYTATATN
ncbi:hypothetical protein J6D24_01180 [Candidatus Saccharibacteria bacterium]|nr:hypothetical protein [Candidatus Saccharibacteria bacterium]